MLTAPTVPTPLLTVEDLAARLRVSKPRAYTIAAMFPAGVTVRFGRRLYIDPARLAALEAQGGLPRVTKARR